MPFPARYDPKDIAAPFIKPLFSSTTYADMACKSSAATRKGKMHMKIQAAGGSAVTDPLRTAQIYASQDVHRALAVF